jgi:hypothetical protein
MQTQQQFRVIGQDDPSASPGDQAATDNLTAESTDVSRNVSTKGSKIALAMLPITPVPFSGTGAIYAWGRLLTYGALSVMLYNKHKTASYVFAGAAGLSLVTSLAAKSWEG